MIIVLENKVHLNSDKYHSSYITIIIYVHTKRDRERLSVTLLDSQNNDHTNKIVH